MTQDELIALINKAADEAWTELDLAGHNLTELPPEIGRLTQLETLLLGKQERDEKGEPCWSFNGERQVPLVVGNALTVLPPEIQELTNLKCLDLSGNPLRSLPSVVAELSSLEKLISVESTLTTIPDEIAQLTNLTTLDLDSNQIVVIPDTITQLINLARLELNSNQITTIPDAIAQLTNLTTLSLYSNQIATIPDAIAQLTNLKTLYLGRNQITTIPDAIAQLTNLETLSLSSNQIMTIPDAIAQLTSLTTLSLWGNQITTIPDALTQLTNLTTLYLYSNQITTIPDVIAQLTNLTTLNLSSNQITTIPDAIAPLINLTTIDLSGNQITTIPHAITQLINLTTIDLSSNQITTIPDAITQLINLTTIDLYSNQITTIPDAITQLTNLATLYLSRNQITTIPNAIAQLTNLTTLNLYSNQITTIPDAIIQLTNLKSLSLHSNQITTIPDAIAQLTNLTSLSLGGNQITTIPDAIAQLTNLTTLDLEDNKIEDIPDCLENLSKLTKLDLRRNSLSISPEVLGPSDVSEDPGLPEEIFRYCRELRSGEKRQLNEAKLLLVGQGSVGKTSLINRLLNNSYNPQQSQTDGLQVTIWPVEVNSKPVRLHVWDFGGQEIYHATHQFFLTKRSLYILTCNCRTSEEENRIEYWLKLIQSFGDGSPVIIVGNKYDEQPLDINRKALQDKYPNIKAILETSCQTGHGIEELKALITREVALLDDVYNLLPLTWFQVKEQLEAMDQDFITYSEYSCLCHEQKVTQEQSKEQLIDLLHNLGLVLNFRDHPILKDTNVLNPDWVTTGIYALLSDETLKTQNKGILIPTDLTRILDPTRYPSQRHPYLTELMKEFQLGFLLNPDLKPQKFLIPGLLPKEEPEETDLQGDTLDFQYHYKILPESILSRFIVLTHENIHANTYWRSGVMLAYTESTEINNIARVKADPEDRKIFISISGKDSNRRSVLFTLRQVFNKIHDSFANLEVTEWVPVPGHPKHPPLDYQELLGLENMGAQEHLIGKLGIRVPLRQLLDGYEPIETRQRKRREARGEKDFPEDRLPNFNPTLNIRIDNHQSQGDNQPMTSNYTNNLQGANIANNANEVKDNARQQANQHNHPAAQQSLTEAAAELSALFAQLDQSYNRDQPAGQDMITAKAVEAIKGKPTLQGRLMAAIKEGGTATIEVAVDHPATKPVLAAIKGFMKGS
jgi:internalin A